MRKYWAWSLAVYVAGIIGMTWVNLTLLCRGDPKFDRGCGGFELYAPVGILVLAPVFLASITAALAGPVPRRPALLVVLALATTFAAAVALETLQRPYWSWSAVLVAAVFSALVVLSARLVVERSRLRRSSAGGGL